MRESYDRGRTRPQGSRSTVAAVLGQRERKDSVSTRAVGVLRQWEC